jgi:hypothetical protein
MITNTAFRAGPNWRRGIREARAPGAPGTQAAVKPLAPAMRRLLFAAAVLVFLAGFQLFVLTEHTGIYFAWTIANPLAAAFLGASYWASLSIEALAGRQAAWANARISVPAVFVFTVLTLVTTLLHLDKFHFGGSFAASTQVVTWAWIAIYVLVPLLMLIMLAVQARIPGQDPPRSAALPVWVYGALAVQAVGLFGFGVALFAAPSQTAPLWPWKLTPLLAQATGAWLIGLGVAAAHALLERDAPLSPRRRRICPARRAAVHRARPLPAPVRMAIPRWNLVPDPLGHNAADRSRRAGIWGEQDGSGR